MKKLLTLIITSMLALTLHAQTVAVLGFETDNFCIEGNTGTMSDLLTDELVNITTSPLWSGSTLTKSRRR